MEKPILFNTPMIQAILDGRKSRTSRPIKHMSEAIQDAPAETIEAVERFPYQVGDVLWVRETWCDIWAEGGTWRKYGYKADGIPTTEYWGKLHPCWPETYYEHHLWRPSIHMPRVAARLFLKVTGVKAQRIQEITTHEIEQEGWPFYKDGKLIGYEDLWNIIYASPQPKKENGIITHYESYPWNNIQETREYMGLPWIIHGNPWCWVYEFERMEGKNGD